MILKEFITETIEYPKYLGFFNLSLFNFEIFFILVSKLKYSDLFLGTYVKLKFEYVASDVVMKVSQG